MQDRHVWILAAVGGLLILVLIGIIGSWRHFVSIFIGLEDTFGIAGKVFLITLAIVVPCALCLLIIALGAKVYWMLFKTVKPTAEGNYEALVGVTGRIISIQAGNGPVPHTYNSRVDTHQPKMLAGPVIDAEAEQVEEALALPSAPPFPSVLPLVRPDRLVLCYTGARSPVFGTVDDLLSTNVNGKPGRGKTSLLYFIIAQLLISQAEITVFDPHGSMKELEGVFTYIDNYEAMSEYVPTMEQMIYDRLDRWKARHPIETPHLLVVDEAPAIAAWENKQAQLYKTKQREMPHNSILQLIQTIILEARKLKVYVIIAGQSMPATVLPTIARDNLSSHYVFFSSNSHAKMAGLEKDDIDELLPLLKGAGPGLCVFDAVRRSEAEIGAIPQTTLDDLLALVPTSQQEEEWDYEQPVPLSHFSPKRRETQDPMRSTGELLRDACPIRKDELQEAVAAWKSGAKSIRKLQAQLDTTYYQAQKLYQQMRAQGLIESAE